LSINEKRLIAVLHNIDDKALDCLETTATMALTKLNENKLLFNAEDDTKMSPNFYVLRVLEACVPTTHVSGKLIVVTIDHLVVG